MQREDQHLARAIQDVVKDVAMVSASLRVVVD